MSKKRFLLIGSAPYMPEWWARRGRALRAEGYVLAAINNAWRVPEEAPDIWIHPNDYYAKSPREMHPPAAAVERMWEVGADVYRDRYGAPVTYSRRHGGTMLLNALTCLLNISVTEGGGEIVISGCDLNYPAAGSHFYTGGTPDPLRAGVDWIREDLLDIHERQLPALRRAGHVLDVYNASPLLESVLPFPRI
ncbi:MAG: hypothetical protein JOZ96_04710 [Acidobacteria bacterium]|nr:hypothetical protein [Acidobacteriota bacterium]